MNAPQIPYEPDESEVETLFWSPSAPPEPPPAAPVYDPPCKIPALAAFEKTENPVTSEWVVVEDPS